MKDSYVVPSDRYGRLHSMERLENGNYKFVPEASWMPVYINLNDDGSLAFMDTEGGPLIGVGFETDEFVVTNVIRRGNTFEFVLEDKEERE